MNSPEYVLKNPDDESCRLHVYMVEFESRKQYIVTLIDEETGMEDMQGIGSTVNDALWDMTASPNPSRNYAIHALYERYGKGMGEWNQNDKRLLNIEHEHVMEIEKFYRELEI